MNRTAFSSSVFLVYEDGKHTIPFLTPIAAQHYADLYFSKGVEGVLEFLRLASVLREKPRDNLLELLHTSKQYIAEECAKWLSDEAKE